MNDNNGVGRGGGGGDDGGRRLVWAAVRDAHAAVDEQDMSRRRSD